MDIYPLPSASQLESHRQSSGRHRRWVVRETFDVRLKTAFAAHFLNAGELCPRKILENQTTMIGPSCHQKFWQGCSANSWGQLEVDWRYLYNPDFKKYTGGCQQWTDFSGPNDEFVSHWMQHDATIVGVHHDFKWFPDYEMNPWSHSESVNELGLSGSVRSKRLKSNKLPPWPQARRAGVKIHGLLMAPDL